MSPSYSETLDFMIAFFEDNNLSPYDTLGMNRTSLQNVLNKRLDAVISILRQVEETQLKPTKKVLKFLFQGIEDTKPLILEKSTITKPIPKAENEALIYYRNAYFKQQAELIKLKHKFKDTIGKFKLVKKTFSSNIYSLKVSEQEYTELKNNVF
ncbi:BfmA/BtgA family mobilization protein [Cellulophaga baltica]|uniref:BfmA/BtgA family mobilization protein n=1 Tax=Cellulophaga baltica TaxID=76594 RepID=UPI0037C6C71A